MPNTLKKHPQRPADMPRCIAEVEGVGYEADPPSAPITEFPPSFFIVGAPRCGTTAVSKALGRNPNINFSKPKEPHYFLEERPGMSAGEQRQQYLARYHRDLTPEQQAIGDGSVSYLYSPEAIRRVLEFDPRAKFIVLVRDPVEMMRSYHSRMLYQLDEDQVDFAKAWALQENRATGRDLPPRCREPMLLQYAFLGRLGEHLERLLEVAGRERVHVIFHEDFVADPRAVYVRALEFVGADDDGRTKFKRTRETSGFRSPWLQQFVMNPPPWTYRLIMLSNTRMLKRLKGVRKRIKAWNSSKAKPRQILTDEMRAELRAYFSDDVQKLSTLTERDLGHWQAHGRPV